MKKKVVILLLLILTVGAISGCGNSGSGATFLKDVKVEKYVTLGEYNGLEVTIEPLASVDDSRSNELMEYVYYNSITAENGGITDREVQNGDTIYIDYEGRKDGIAFAGGTATDAELIIGSNMFIEGFEEGLIGVMPGETVDLNLTFPEVYQNQDLAGQEVVFKVTVNYILPAQMKDEVVASWEDERYSNLEELKQFVYDYIVTYNTNEYEMSLRSAVLEQFYNNCTFKEIPQKIMDPYRENMRKEIEEAAAMQGMDGDTLVNYYFQTTLENYLDENVEEFVKMNIAYQAVANKESLTVSDEELDERLLEYAISAGYSSIEEFIDPDQREFQREFLLYEKVQDFLVENAVAVWP